jgi:hypothetical protein
VCVGPVFSTRDGEAAATALTCPSLACADQRATNALPACIGASNERCDVGDRRFSVQSGVSRDGRQAERGVVRTNGEKHRAPLPIERLQTARDGSGGRRVTKLAEQRSDCLGVVGGRAANQHASERWRWCGYLSTRAEPRQGRPEEND